MSVTKEQVRERIVASTDTVSDDDIASALTLAQALVAKYVGTSELPTIVRDEATLAVAVEKINIDQAPNGVLNQQYDLTDGTTVPLRIGRDPMKPALALLAPYVSAKFFCG